MRYCIRFCCLLLLADAANGQTNSGAIGGTVTDKTGLVIAGAEVTITNLGTNQSIKLVTSQAGSYALANQPPVFFRVAAVAPGFKRAVADKVKVDTATQVTVDLTLEVGDTSQSVTVEAAPPLLNSESGAQGHTITEEQVLNLPFQDRSVLELAVTLPNVSGNVDNEDPRVDLGTPSPGFAININGGRPGEGSILADGANNISNQGRRQMASFSPEVMQEFTVQTGTFSAEYGSTGGGIINTTTKSGTNQLRGLAYWYNRNPFFAASPWSASAVRRETPNLKQNNVGLTVGGPVVLPYIGPKGLSRYNGRGRSFFFVAVEPRRTYNRNLANSGLVPSEAMRKGDFSNACTVDGGLAPCDVAARLGRPAVPLELYNQTFQANGQLYRVQAGDPVPAFPNNVIPSQWLDPIALKIAQAIPAPSPYYLDDAGLLRNTAASTFVRNRETRYTVRLDHQVTDTNKLSFRYTNNPIYGERGYTNAGDNSVIYNSPGNHNSASSQYLLNHVYIIRPTVINDLRLSYTRGDYAGSVPNAWKNRNWAAELGLPTASSWGLPQFTTGAYNVGQTDQARLNINLDQNFNITDSLSIVRGKSSWKLGADLYLGRWKFTELTNFPGGQYTFTNILTQSAIANGTGGHAFAQFLMGIPSNVQMRSAIVPYYYSWRSASFFVQNDWRLRPNLTLNLGLRYSLQLPRTEKHHLQGSYRPELARNVAVPQEPLCTVATRPCPAANQVRLPEGMLPKEALIVPFHYSGVGANSPYMAPVDWNDVQPRFGFAWSPRIHGRRIVIRGGYGLSYAPSAGVSVARAIPDIGGSITDAYTYNNNRGTYQKQNPGDTALLRLSTNPPDYTFKTPNVRIPDNGIVYEEALALAGPAVNREFVSPNFRSPGIHNWSFTLSGEIASQTVLTVGYQGAHSSSLFLPPRNTNYLDPAVNTQLAAAGLNPSQVVYDPLGRRNPATGQVVTVLLSSVFSRYLGFANFTDRFNAIGRSDRHAGFISLQRRMRQGLNFNANYTWGKTIDDAGDSGDSQTLFGAYTSLQGGFLKDPPPERSVSEWDRRHIFNLTFYGDLPMRRNSPYLARVPPPLKSIIIDWRFSGIYRAMTGTPVHVLLGDTNGAAIADNRVGAQLNNQAMIRPNLVLGVPVLNPYFDRNKDALGTYEPFLNPAAFTRPPKGQVGNLARTLDWLRTPGLWTFNLSLQKNFYAFGRDSKRYFEFRVDAQNVLNHINFGFGPHPSQWGIFTATSPSEADITAAEYRTWQAYDPSGRPALGTPAGDSLFAQIQNLTRSQRPNGAATGPLPDDFYTVRLPDHFKATNQNAFDISTMEGLKYYRLRQVYNNGFTTYNNAQQTRYLTFGLRFFF
jgi:hypothetical protein